MILKNCSLRLKKPFLFEGQRILKKINCASPIVNSGMISEDNRYDIALIIDKVQKDDGCIPG